MKDAEDEAFDELARKQGAWGGGFQAKRQMAMDKLQEPAAMDDRQRLEAIVSVICKYLPPDGIPINDAMSEIISLVDPLPAPQREWVGLTEKDFSAINQSCLTKLQAATSAESILKEKNF